MAGIYKPIYKPLGDLLRTEMRQNRLTIEFLADQLSHQEGIDYTPSGLFGIIRDMRDGFVYGSKRIAQRPRVPAERLNVLSAVLYALGVEENHQVVRELKGFEIGFQYPPDKGIRYEEILAARDEAEANEEHLRVLLHRLRTEVKPADYNSVTKFLDDLVGRQESS